MRFNKLQLASLLMIAFTWLSCSEEITNSTSPDGLLPLNLTGQIHQENVTRANDYGFVTGDRMGIYVVDYENGQPGDLSASGIRAQNVLYTFDGETYKWSSPTTIYWRDKQTPVSIYGYYPGVNYIQQPTAYQFSVQTDQSTEAANGELSGYEQSDLLWGKEDHVEFTQEQIVVKYRHILAGVRVHLEKGTGISDTEWGKLEKIVLIDHTITSATIDLSNGSITTLGSGEAPIHMASQSDDSYRAVVIPQTVDAGKQLISLTLDGQTYSHKLSADMNYLAGKLHNFTLTVNKSEITGDYEISVADDGISPWQNDESSHMFTALAYVTVNCPQYGTLAECIAAAGYDYKTVQNLKVTGELTDTDFNLLRDGMPELKHLNLKDVNIRHVYHSYWTSNSNGSLIEYYTDDELPPHAFYNGAKSLRSIVLPSSLKVLGEACFSGTRLMYSTLEIPEGVNVIGGSAFAFTGGNNGVELILPNTLDSIHGGAFMDCGYKCELKLNDNISHIGGDAFAGCDNFYGVFHIPSNLKELAEGMFGGLGHTGNFTGTIEIPQGITEIPGRSLLGSVFPVLSNRIDLILPSSIKRIGRGAMGGKLRSLKLNEGLEIIDEENFSYGSMPFQLSLPSTLHTIGSNSFCASGFEGELIIPDKCVNIGGGCFRDNEFTSIHLPSRLEAIGRSSFSGNHRLTTVTIPRYVNFIAESAFNDCDALQTVICLNPEPPEIEGAIFQGTYFDKCILQVPETSVEKYRHTAGWDQFKNITAYHELAFNIPEIVTLHNGCTEQGVIRAEGAWEVIECPDWVTVSPMSGTIYERKAELTINVKPLGSLTESREGRIVFRLKDKNYSTYTTVKQNYYADLNEDQTVVLQEASAGAPRAIPIFIIGEGYNADDIVSGQYLSDMREQMEHLFSCEPYKSYRNYFTVSTAIAVSPGSGISGRMRFHTNINWYKPDDAVWQYAKEHGVGITNEREGQTTILVLYNSNYLGANGTSLKDNGRTISYIGKSTDDYPYDQRGFVLREVGGIAFGKLANEAVNHFTFIKACTCPECNALNQYEENKRRGWYENVSLSSKMNDAPWSHLIFDERFAQYVDMYEGGMNHARGVYRSENMSVMGDTFIPYYNTISRQAIVKRILEYSGAGYTFEKFIANDKREYPE